MLLSPGPAREVLCHIRVPHCKGACSAWIKAQKPIRSLEKSGLGFTGIGLQEKSCARGADPGELLPRMEARGKAEVCGHGDDSVALGEPGQCPGEPQTPSLAREEAFSVPVGPKGQPWQCKEMLRSLSLRRNISDVKKLSIGRAGAKGSKCPCLLV